MTFGVGDRSSGRFAAIDRVAGDGGNWNSSSTFAVDGHEARNGTVRFRFWRFGLTVGDHSESAYEDACDQQTIEKIFLRGHQSLFSVSCGA